MADRQFVAPFGTTSTPADWKPPALLQLLLKTAFARYNGAAAPGSYKPCLRLISDSGHVVVEAVATTTVAAGASADVSWFQDVDLSPAVANWPNSNYVTSALAFGPWAYWKLNEAAGSTTVADSSGHGRTLNVNTGQESLGRTGLVPTSADTCAYTTWISSSTATSFASAAAQTFAQPVVSVVLWLNMPVRTGNQRWLFNMGTIGATASRLFGVIIDTTGQPIFQYQDSGGVLRTINVPAGVADNSRHQVAFVLDGTNLTTYLDGVQADQQAQPAAMKNTLTGTAFLGQPTGGAGARFTEGYLQDVGWYDKVLTAANILSLYQAATQLPS